MGVAETVNRCRATPSQLVDVCANKVFSFSLLLVLAVKLYPYILFKELASSFGSQSLFSGLGEHLHSTEILANFLCSCLWVSGSLAWHRKENLESGRHL